MPERKGVARHIEMSADGKNFDEACQNAITEAAKTMRGITQFWVKDVLCQVENNKVTNVRVNGKLSFILE